METFLPFLPLIFPFIKLALPYLAINIVVFLITMAIVFFVGRMLELTKSNRIKNTIATFSILGFNYYFYQAYTNLILTMIINSSIGILLYVLIGFHLYDRFDDFLDRHFGKDKIRRKR